VGTASAEDMLATSFIFGGPALPVRTSRSITVTAKDAAGLSTSCVALLYLEAPQVASSVPLVSATALSTSSGIVELQLSNTGEHELVLTVLGTRVVDSTGQHPQWVDVDYRHQSTVVKVGAQTQHTFILCPPTGCISSGTISTTVVEEVTLMITLDGARTGAAGTVNSTLEVDSNDPHTPVKQIPIQFVVNELPIVAMVLPPEIDLTLTPNEEIERPVTVHNVFQNIDAIIASSREQCGSDCSVQDPSGTRPAIDVGQGITVADVLRISLETACQVLPEDSLCPHEWSRVRDSGNIVVVHENCTCDTQPNFPCAITPTQPDFSLSGGVLRTTSW